MNNEIRMVAIQNEQDCGSCIDFFSHSRSCVGGRMGDATVDDELPVKSLVLWHSNGITSLYHQYKFPAKNVGHPLKRRGTQWQRPTLTKNEMTNKKNVFVNFHIVSSFCRYKRIQKFCYFMAHPKNLECGPHFLENKLRLNPLCYERKVRC